MANKRVRVHEKDYNLIKELAEKEDITQAEAVHRLIFGEYVVEGGELKDVGQADGGSKLFWGAVATAGAMVAKNILDSDSADGNKMSSGGSGGG